MRNLLIIFILALSSNLYADSESEKIAAAKRYLDATLMSEMLNDMATKMAAQIPENNRADFIKVMTEEVDINLLESAAIDAMIKTFTVEELNAFADFYGSEVGKSAMSKFGTYMSLVMPTIQQEVVRAIKQVEGVK